MKYVGLDTETLGWVLCAVLLGAGGAWMAIRRPWETLGASAELAADRSTDVTLPELAVGESPAGPDGD